MKIKKIATRVITILAVVLVIVSGIMKFIAAENVVASLDKMGVLPYRLFLGSMEICFALLFLFKPTMKPGFILLTCYFSGALAVELSHTAPFSASLPLMLVWISAFLRDKSLFFSASSPGLAKA